MINRTELYDFEAKIFIDAAMESKSQEYYRRYLERLHDDVKSEALKPLEKYMTR